MFVEDDYKITPKLTLNLGIRYDLQELKDNNYSYGSSFVPSIGKAVVFAKQYPASVIPAFIPDTVLASSVGLPSSLFGYLGQDTNNVAPRFGFAYQPLPHTVVREAFGIFYNLLPGTYAQSPAFSNLPFAASQTFTQPADPVPATTGSSATSGIAVSARSGRSLLRPLIAVVNSRPMATLMYEFAA